MGGDGFCGWPTSLHLSSKGYDVKIVDNLSRRNIDIELGVESLTPITSIYERIKTWREISKNEITFENIDIAQEYNRLKNLINEYSPDIIIHFAEQRAAPFSMKSARHKCYTVNNNLNATHNILAAIVEVKKDIHLVHLGTMGVYGYSTVGLPIPEGYLDIKLQTNSGLVDQQILYPTNPGSIYHMTKSQDQLMFAFYNKNDGLRITDLHQGIVWGTQTAETLMDSRLINRFDYDGDYGTVLNRFVMQGALNYPLTVHGSGGQTRAFIHINDTVKCLEIACENPPVRGDRVQIFNQMSETHRVKDLAKLVASLTNTEIAFLENPRNEADQNELKVVNDNLKNLGLNPTLLSDGVIHEIRDIAQRYIERCDKALIPCKSIW